MTKEDASLILELLRQIRAEFGDVQSHIGQIRADTGAKSDLGTVRADVASDMRTLRADIAAEILATRKDLSDQIDGLRQTVVEYQAMALRLCPSLRRLTAT